MDAITLEETADFGQGVEEMKPRNRAAGAVREAVFKSDDQCGAVIALSHLLRNNSDDPAVPAFGRENQRVTPGKQCRRTLHTSDNFIQNLVLHVLPLTVQ